MSISKLLKSVALPLASSFLLGPTAGKGLGALFGGKGGKGGGNCPPQNTPIPNQTAPPPPPAGPAPTAEPAAAPAEGAAAPAEGKKEAPAPEKKE